MPVSPIASIKAFVIALAVAGVLMARPTGGHAQAKSQERLGVAPANAEQGKDNNRIGTQPGDSEALPEVFYDIGKLPPKVRDTLTRVLGAAHSGKMAVMGQVIKDNKHTPAFTFGEDQDPIAYWKRVSRDDDGREMLAEMVKVFSSGFVRADAGTSDELYVWPYHFVYPLEALTPSQQVEFYVLVNPEDAQTMIESGGYYGFRGAISPDGTWQYFIAGD